MSARFKRRRVVHAVAGDRHDLARLLEGGNDAQLVERAGAGQHHAGAGEQLPQRRLAEPRDVGAGGHRRLAGDDADLARDGLGGQRVVPGDDDDADAGHAGSASPRRRPQAAAGRASRPAR
jgi:hypothetical protein